MDPDFFKTFVSLFALIDPIGAVPVFIGLTAQQTATERNRTMRTAAVAVFAAIAVSALVGRQLMGFFGISIPALKVGGGIVLLLMGIEMLRAEMAPERTTKAETDAAGRRASVAVVPLAIPLMMGPGALSTVIVYADRSRGWQELAGLIGVGGLIGLSVWLSFRLAEPIERVLGVTGINVATRVMGLVLAALAVEFVTQGLVELVPGLRR